MFFNVGRHVLNRDVRDFDDSISQSPTVSVAVIKNDYRDLVEPFWFVEVHDHRLVRRSRSTYSTAIPQVAAGARHLRSACQADAL